MRVLSIDPGYDRCGVAILELKDGREHLLHSACLQTPARMPFPARLAAVGKAVDELIQTFKPSAFAIEQLFFNTNQKTAMRVAAVKGVLVYLAECNNLSVYEYTPSEVKSAVTSWGRAPKEHVTEMVKRLVTIEKPVAFDDEYDAIAVGITCLAHNRSSSPS